MDRTVSKDGFAIWFTGLPGSGKSTLSALVKEALQAKGCQTVILESDKLRDEMITKPGYETRDRELFYSTVVLLGRYLVETGNNVIIDATCNQRKFREAARSRIADFMEVYVNCPLEECIRRDPKGIYRRGSQAKSGTVPGLHASYEPPIKPEIEVDTTVEQPKEAVMRIVERVEESFLRRRRP